MNEFKLAKTRHPSCLPCGPSPQTFTSYRLTWYIGGGEYRKSDQLTHSTSKRVPNLLLHLVNDCGLPNLHSGMVTYPIMMIGFESVGGRWGSAWMR